MAQDALEKFRSGGGSVAGWLGVLVGAAAAVLVVVDGYQPGEWRVLVGCAVFASLFWAVLVRPVVEMSVDELVLRAILSEVRLPLAAVEDVRIRQFVVVRSGGHAWTCTGMGRNRRQLARLRKKGPDTSVSRADFVEARIRQHAENARARAGIQLMSDEQFALGASVRRTWAWPVIVPLVILVLALVIGMLS